FFQAEDGIRVATVTGVQTCALPIWVGGRLCEMRLDVADEGLGVDRLGDVAVEPRRNHLLAVADHCIGGDGYERDRAQLGIGLERSEERRVGKGGSRGGATDGGGEYR